MYRSWPPAGSERLDDDGYPADHSQHQHLAKLEDEQAQLRAYLSQSEGILASTLHEITAAEASSQIEHEAAVAAEKERDGVREELAAFHSAAASVTSQGANDRQVANGAVGEAINTGNGEADSECKTSEPSAVHTEHVALAETQSEAATLVSDTRHFEDKLYLLGFHHHEHHLSLEEAESVARGYYKELDEIVASVQASESQSKSFQEERKRLEADEGPLEDWVRHAELELREARTENSMLSAQLLVVLDRRSNLQRDDLDAVPMRQAGMDVKEVYALKAREQDALARKATMAEEIHDHRCRRGNLLMETAIANAEASAQHDKQQRQNRGVESGYHSDAQPLPTQTSAPSAASAPSTARSVITPRQLPRAPPANTGPVDEQEGVMPPQGPWQWSATQAPKGLRSSVSPPTRQLPRNEQQLSIQSQSLLRTKERQDFVLPEVHEGSDGETPAKGTVGYWATLSSDAEDSPRRR